MSMVRNTTALQELIHCFSDVPELSRMLGTRRNQHNLYDILK